DGEVLAELPMNEIRPLQLLLPIVIRVNLVNEDGALLTAVPGRVALAVSVQVQAPDATAAGHPILPNCGVHGAAVPFDVSGKSDVDRQKLSRIRRCRLLKRAITLWNFREGLLTDAVAVLLLTILG